MKVKIGENEMLERLRLLHKDNSIKLQGNILIREIVILFTHIIRMHEFYYINGYLYIDEDKYNKFSLEVLKDTLGVQ